jgi:adenosylcobinamide-GDP ribazoletransferase
VKAVVQQGRIFICAVQMLTRVPTPQLAGFEPAWTARSVRYFPLVGELVGLVAGAVWLAASRVWPGLPAAALAIGAGVLVTGGFHEDGLADTADGLGGGGDQARKLEIMKDSRIGSYGALALGLVTLLRVAALARCGPWAGVVALVAAHGGARAAAITAMAALPYVGERETAKLPATAARARWSDAVLALVFGLWPIGLAGAVLGPERAGIALGLGAAAALGVALLARRLIGGVTGDVLGAIEQAAEAALLLGAAAA